MGPGLIHALGAALLALTVFSFPPELRAETTDAPEAAAEATATLVVEQLHEQLLDTMKNAVALGYEGRYDKLAAVLGDLFDISFMAQKSVGRYWKRADEAEREQLLATFRRFMIANYAGRFDGYSGQSFEALHEVTAPRETVIVHTRLIDPTGDDVQLNYRLRHNDGHWRIIDVYLNGTVSELALRRSEYSSLIQREGFPALLTALDEKIAQLAAGEGAEGTSG